MSEYITGIKTSRDIKKIDYNSLANLPKGTSIAISDTAPLYGNIWVDTSAGSGEKAVLKYKDEMTQQWIVVSGGGNAGAGTYTDEELISSETKESLGLSDSASPDDALKALQQSKAPMHSYGMEDLVAGVTELESGKLHLIYE